MQAAHGTGRRGTPIMLHVLPKSQLSIRSDAAACVLVKLLLVGMWVGGVWLCVCVGGGKLLLLRGGGIMTVAGIGNSVPTLFLVCWCWQHLLAAPVGRACWQHLLAAPARRELGCAHSYACHSHGAFPSIEECVLTRHSSSHQSLGATGAVRYVGSVGDL